MSENGRTLMEIIERHDLVIVNATSKCNGVITRYRKTSKGEEKSVIDYFLVSKSFYDMVVELKINEGRALVLSNFNVKKPKIVESGHNLMILKANIQWNFSKQKPRNEFFNLKNKDNLKLFKDFTSNCQNLEKCLLDEGRQ